MTSGSHPGYDGVFTIGPLAGNTVNSRPTAATIRPRPQPHPCDYYLVLTGSGRACAGVVLGYRFGFPVRKRGRLLATLTARRIKIGTTTSVRKADWEAARVFPSQQAPPLQLSESQLAQLALFSSQTTRSTE